MASVTAFSFYDDPVTHTNPTVCTIDPVAQTIATPGVTAYPFSKVDELVATIRSLSNQDLSDLVSDNSATIYKDDGTVLLTVTATIAPGTPPSVTTITAGVGYTKTKALDLASGLDHFVLGN